MAKVLRSNVKHDGELIPAGTRMSSKQIPSKLRKQLQETGFFIDEAEAKEEESDAEAQEEEEAGQEEEEG